MTLMLAACGLWALCDGLQQIFINPAIKELANLLSYIGILPLPAAWLVFCAQYAGLGYIFKRGKFTLLLIEPALVTLAILTNSYHHLYYTSVESIEQGGFVYLLLNHGPFFFINTVYTYVLLLIGLLLLIGSTFKKARVYRQQTILITAAVLFSWVSNLVYIYYGNSFPHLDLTPISFMLTGMLMVYNLYRYRSLDLTPRGRNALIEELGDAVILIDEYNRIVDVNRAACELIDLKRNDMLGHMLAEFLNEWDEIRTRFREVRETHELISMKIRGQVFYYDLRIHPILGPRDVYMGRLIILRDETDRQSLHIQIQESEARYRTLFDASPDAIVLTSLHGIVEYYNKTAAQMFCSRNGENYIGTNAYDFFDPIGHTVVDEFSVKAIQSEEPQKFEITCRSLDGRTFPGELSTTVRKDIHGEPVGYISILRDISERKLAEDEIKRIAAAEHKQRQIADALREIGALFNASLDFNTVLDLLLVQVARLIPYDTGSVLLLKGRKAVTVRTFGYDTFGSDATQAISQFVFDPDTTKNIAQMLEQKQPLIISDVLTYPDWQSREETSHIRSWVGAPIIARNQVLAFFSLEKSEPDYFTPDHAHILSAFASQAGLAMQNATLYQETVELLERTRRLNDILQKIDGNLEISVLLDNVLELSCGMLNAPAGLLGLYNKRIGALEPTHKYCPNHPDLHWDPEIRGGYSWQVFSTGEPVWVADTSSGIEVNEFVKGNHITSFLIIPIRSAEEIIGVINFFSFNPDEPLQERDIPIAVTLGREAGEAIRTANLFTAAQRRAEEAEMLRDASAAVTSALNLDIVLNQIITTLEKVVPYDSCSLFLNEDKNLKIVAARGYRQPDLLVGQIFPKDNDLVHQTYTSGQPAIIYDAQIDPLFKKWGESDHIHGWMGIPLFTHGQAVGFLAIDSCTPGAYDKEAAALAQAFANQAAIAIDNARLYERTQHLAITDSLTELYNRRHFFDLARNEFYRTRRYTKNLALMMIDIDDLKLVNDTYGHMVGDQLIEFIGAQMRIILRISDIAGRYAGDEFIILLPETALEGAVQVGERLHAELAKGFETKELQHIPIGISVGVASLDDTCYSLEILINRADQAMYFAKQSGKNSVFAWMDGDCRPGNNLGSPILPVNVPKG